MNIKKFVYFILIAIFCLFFLYPCLSGSGEEKVPCPHCGYLNSPSDRYCINCMSEMRPITEEELKEIAEQIKEKVLDFYDKARENYFKAQNSVDKATAKHHYELSLSYSQKALLEGGKRLSNRLRKELKKISWISKQRLAVLREILKNPVSRIPLKKRDKAYYIEVTLNDKVDAVLHLDTGCSTTLISPEIADKLSIKGGKEVFTVLADGTKVKGRSITLDSIKAGEQEIKDVPVVIMETTGDGLLGMSFLKHFVFKIDTDADQLVLK